MMKRKTHYTLHLILLVLLCFAAGKPALVLAQSPISAEVNRTTLSVNDELTLTVTVTGDLFGIAVPELAGMTDFIVIGTDTSTQLSVINGKVGAKSVFVYRLQPLQTGSLVISPLSVTVDSKTYQTKAITVEVTANSGSALPVNTPPPNATAPANLAGGDVFVEAEVDNPTPYLGQQIIYIFRFYQANDAQLNTLDRPDYRPPSFTGFWGQKVLSQPYYSTTKEGRNYLITEVHTALFPANPGSATISPARLIIPGDLFSSEIMLQTNPVTLEVRSLPDGAPSDFSGGVGQFKIAASLSAAKSKVNEPLTLNLDIEGAGNVEVITEPAFPELPGWRIFNSQSSTNVETQGDVVYGRRRFERLLVPGQPGDYTIPAISFNYYDPQRGEYRQLKTDPLPVTIEPGNAESSPTSAPAPDKQPVKVTADDIRHIKPVPPSLESAGGLLLVQPLYWFFWILPALVVGGVWLGQKRRQRLLLDTAYARSQRARRAAQKILSGANQPGVDGYAAAHHALLGYLSDKLNRPTSGLTNAELTNLLAEQHLPQTLIEQVQAILTRIEAGRFGPVEEAAVQVLIAETHKLINTLEKTFGGRR
jgi:hypothetical protein